MILVYYNEVNGCLAENYQCQSCKFLINEDISEVTVHLELLIRQALTLQNSEWELKEHFA